jgi:RNA polymerase sigma factor (sigma-70 family)
MPDEAEQFAQVVDTHYEAVYRFAYSLTLSESDAGDLTQETFYIWATKSHQIRDQGKAKSWLFTTLHRLFLGRKRRENRFPHQPIEAAEACLPSLESNAQETLDGKWVMQALHSLEEAHRLPLALFYIENLSYQEIAEAMELPIGTIMSRLSRGKEHLRQRLMDQPASRSNVVPISYGTTGPNGSRHE